MLHLCPKKQFYLLLRSIVLVAFALTTTGLLTAIDVKSAAVVKEFLKYRETKRNEQLLDMRRTALNAAKKAHVDFSDVIIGSLSNLARSQNGGFDNIEYDKMSRCEYPIESDKFKTLTKDAKEYYGAWCLVLQKIITDVTIELDMEMVLYTKACKKLVMNGANINSEVRKVINYQVDRLGENDKMREYVVAFINADAELKQEWEANEKDKKAKEHNLKPYLEAELSNIVNKKELSEMEIFLAGFEDKYMPKQINGTEN